MNKMIVILLLFILPYGLKAQFLNNSQFRIYRAEFIFGAVTQLRIDSDGTYKISISEIHCSLCDHEELRNRINCKGNWEIESDTIFLDKGKYPFRKLLLVEDSIIRPLFVMGINIDSLPDSTKVRFNEDFLNSDLNDFHLVYDTYPNGVAKTIIDKYRLRKNEYVIKLKPDGSIKSVDFYWDNKKRKRLK